MVTWIENGVTAPKGFLASGVHCGIRKNKQKADLALIYSEKDCAAAAVYTQNLVKGAPILVTKKNLADGKARAVICNSGNANTCNADGEAKAWQMCEIAAKALHIAPEDVIVASTGVIGEILPIAPIAGAAEALVKELSPMGSNRAANAIMTTDLLVKEIALEREIAGKTVRIGGIAKGSGMIHPNMATMLCFMTTDIAISAALLQKALSAAVRESFNMVSVDGDTSTNDMVSIMASGLAGNPEITEENEAYAAFVQALKTACIRLCKMIAKDGEGATKLLICSVSGAADQAAAAAVAKSVIASSLVKTAMFGADANWGRVLCAIGYAGVAVAVQDVEVSFVSKQGEISVCRNGAGVSFDEAAAKKVLLEDEIEIRVVFHEGTAFAQAYGCDLTYDYVKINGDYRT